MSEYNLTTEEIKLECAKVAFNNGSRFGIEKDACLKIAEKIYKFVVGKTEESPEQTTTG